MNNVDSIFKLLDQEKYNFLQDLKAPLNNNSQYTSQVESLDPELLQKVSPETPSLLYQRNRKNTRIMQKKMNKDDETIKDKLSGQNIEWVPQMLMSRKKYKRLFSGTSWSVENPRRSERIKRKGTPKKRKSTPKKRSLESDDDILDMEECTKPFRKRLRQKADPEALPHAVWESVDSDHDENEDNFETFINQMQGGSEESEKEETTDEECAAEDENMLGYKKDGFIVPDKQYSSDGMILDEPHDVGPMEYTPVKTYTLKELVGTERSHSTPSSFTCLEPLHIANLDEVLCNHSLLTSKVWRDRLNPMLLESDSNIMLHAEKDPEKILRFQTFFACPRSRWHTNKYFVSLFQRCIQPCLMMGGAGRSENHKKMLRLVSANRAMIKTQCFEPYLDKCDGCGLKHRVLTHSVELLDSEGCATGESLYFGPICGKKLEAVESLFKILNSLPLLPFNKKYMENALAYLNFCEIKCTNAIDTIYSEKVQDEEIL